jgi:hypothetical protein
MIKCLFVDIANISSDVSKAEFDNSEIERLADLILATGGLIRPLLLRQTSEDQYIILQGDLEYYAAVRAKEKDLRKAETVNAFIIPEDVRQVALAQLAIVAQPKSSQRSLPTKIHQPIAEIAADTAIVSPNDSFDRLASQLRAEISQQLQPLQQQLDTVSLELDRHNQILAALAIEKDDRACKASIATKPRSTATSKADKKPEKSPVVQPQELTPAVNSVELPPPAATPKKATTAKKTAPASTSPKDRVKPDAFGAVDPEKLVSTLNLINTLNLDNLTLRMAKSGIVSAETLAANIIDKRDTQPLQRFETWEAVILAKVPKLTTPKLLINIINKLK